MLVLIDESGCPGFKLEKGSTSHFVIGMVIFKDLSIAEKINIVTQNLRESLKVKPEFKFSKSADIVKDKFFEAISPYSFSIRVLVVEKRIVYSQHLRQQKESFYNFFVRNLLEYDDGCLHGATIKIDGSGNKEFQRALQSYLTNHVGKEKIKKLKMINSKRDNLIQLADMVVGAIARKYNTERKNHDRWFKMIEKKINNTWDFR